MSRLVRRRGDSATGDAKIMRAPVSLISGNVLDLKSVNST